MFNFLKRKPKQPDARQWLMESIRYFREMGFYQEASELSDEEFVFWWGQRKAKQWEEDEAESLAPEQVVAYFDDTLTTTYEQLNRRLEPWEFEASVSEADCFLLACDANRIWWEDLEQDIYFGDDIYKRVIEEWSRISRGVFLPAHIEEIWETEEGPMQIEMLLSGERYRLIPNRHEENPEEFNGWIDLELLSQINEILDKTDIFQRKGYRFEVHQAFDQTGYVLALNSAEKTKLMQERGWKFMDLTEE